MNINNLMEDAYSSMYQTEEELSEEGKKDACYHKVKSRYDVWPSAYASGALVKCRKKGAKNWGNSAKKEEMEMVFAFLMNEGFASTEDDALAIIDSMSDMWYDSIMEGMLDEENLRDKNRRLAREKRARGGNKPDEEAVEIKPEPKKPEYNATPGKTKKLKTADNPHNVRQYLKQTGGGGGAAKGAPGGQVGGMKGNFNQEGGKQVGLGASKPKTKS